MKQPWIPKVVASN